MLVAILFIVLGGLIKYGKMYFLIAGYNTMSKTEKEKYDINSIATVFRNAMFGMAALILLGVLVARLTQISQIENIAFWVALVLGIPYLMIRSNAKRFKKSAF